MAKRNLLRSQLQAAWQQTIRGPYADQLINSERGLQVHFCMELLRQFSSDDCTRRLFIEPGVVFDDGVHRSPDLLICNSCRIIGVVEFKYTPRMTPKVVKDLNTLCRLSLLSIDITISNARFRGEGVPRHYSIASDAVLCWAGVHASNDFEFLRNMVDQLGGRFLCLEAVTQPESQAEIRTSSKPRTHI